MAKTFRTLSGIVAVAVLVWLSASATMLRRSAGILSDPSLRGKPRPAVLPTDSRHDTVEGSAATDAQRIGVPAEDGDTQWWTLHTAQGCRGAQRSAAQHDRLHLDLSRCLRRCATLDTCTAVLHRTPSDDDHRGLCLLLHTACTHPEDDIEWDTYTLDSRTAPPPHRTAPRRATPRRHHPGTQALRIQGAPQTPTRHGDEGTSRGGTAGPPDSLSAVGDRVEHADDLRDGMFVTVRSSEHGIPIGLPYSRPGGGAGGGGAAAPGAVGIHEVLRMVRVAHKSDVFWAFQSSLGTFLSAETNDRYSIDRRRVKSMERFLVEFPRALDGSAAIRAFKSRKLLSAAPHAEEHRSHRIVSKKAKLTEPSVRFDIHQVDCRHWLCGLQFNATRIREATRGTSQGGRGGVARQRLLLFTSPKPLREKRLEAQRHIFATWRRLPQVETLIISDSDEVLEEARAHGLRVDASLELHPEYRQPTYRGLFRTAFASQVDGAAASLVMYSNADILYTPSLTESLDAVLRFREEHHAGKPLLVIGQRTNTDVPEGFAYSGDDWAQRIEQLEDMGTLFQPDAEDYFIVSRDVYDWDDMPDFVVGGAAFDNWFVAQVIRSGRALVVDVTRTATVVHQNHDKGRKASLSTPKSAYNLALSRRTGGTARGMTTDSQFATVRTLSGIQILQRNEFYL